jgi:hypothetical protein
MPSPQALISQANGSRTPDIQAAISFPLATQLTLPPLPDFNLPSLNQAMSFPQAQHRRARFGKKGNNKRFSVFSSKKAIALVSVLMSTSLLASASDCETLSSGFPEVSATNCCAASSITCEADRVVMMCVFCLFDLFSYIAT